MWWSSHRYVNRDEHGRTNTMAAVAKLETTQDDLHGNEMFDTKQQHCFSSFQSCLQRKQHDKKRFRGRSLNSY